MQGSDKELIKGLVDWMELKGVEVTEKDRDFFKSVVMLARNNGSRSALEEIERQTVKKLARETST